jgi:hypothetical protein
MSTLYSLIQHSLGIPSQSNKTGRRKKGIQIEKEVQLSLFADHMTLYLTDLELSTKKSLNIINTFSKVAGYKINL